MKQPQHFSLAIVAAVAIIVGWSIEKAYAIQPFFTSNNFTIPQGQDSNVASVVVPPGSTWVLESMSGRIQMPSGQHILDALIFVVPTPSIPSPAVLHAVPSLVSQFPGSVDIYLFNTLTRAYLTGTVVMSVNRAEIQGDTQVNFALHGYLIPTLSGDYNANGTVDAADYVLYRKTLGQSGIGLSADGNDTNSIEPGDFGVWRSRFGITSAAGSSSAASATVPEPASILVFGLMAAAGSLTFRRRSVRHNRF